MLQTIIYLALAMFVGPAYGQVLQLASGTIACDQEPHIRVLGLMPEQDVLVRAELSDGAGQQWSAEAGFSADRNGIVDLSTQAPSRGSYRGISAAGLLWSMMPSAKGIAVYRPPQDMGPQGIQISVVASGRELAHGQLTQLAPQGGGELALQLGSMYPQIRSVIAYVPANVRGPGCCGRVGAGAWSWNGLQLSYAFPGENESRARGLKAEIEAEHTHGSILLISGGEDEIWPSRRMSELVMQRLKGSRFPYRFEHLAYAHAGHRAGNPEIAPAWTGDVQHPLSGRRFRYGGTPEGNALSTIDADPKVLSFLQDSFGAATVSP